MRILLTKESSNFLFECLRNKNGVSTNTDLARKMNVPYKTLEKWIYRKRYTPKEIIPKEILSKISILNEEADNWGSSKGGAIGGKRNASILKEKLGKKKYSDMMRQRGRKIVRTLWKRYAKKELIRMAVEGKHKKRTIQSQELEEQNKSFFSNEKVGLDTKAINFSCRDIQKGIMFPKEMTEELAEEIGIHLGDGCLSYKKNYFSVKTNKIEEEYMTKFIFPLYKKLFDLNLKLMRLPSVVGFEIGSKALCEFKNKVIGLPCGEKVERTEIPSCILRTKNKRVYRAFIRGLFDTDGCVSIVKKNYPSIQITIKSKKLIAQLTEMLKKLGFIPTVYNWNVRVNGPIMLEKWIKEINSNNPKNIARLNRASSIAWIVRELAV